MKNEMTLKDYFKLAFDDGRIENPDEIPRAVDYEAWWSYHQKAIENKIQIKPTQNDIDELKCDVEILKACVQTGLKPEDVRGLYLTLESMKK